MAQYIDKAALIEQISALKDIVEREDIPGLINMIEDMSFNKDNRSGIYCYTRKLLIEFISEYLKFKGLDSLKVNRRGEYQTTTCDTYRMSEEGLIRNGHSVEFDSVGKLYQAYKRIRKI